MTIKTKILLVEDEESIHKLLHSCLIGEDYKLISAMSADEGIKAAAMHLPDVVILDLGLPEKTGFEVIKAIREWNKATPILVLSARTDEQSKVKALDEGANDYVTKPFSTAELLARIRALIRSVARHVSESSELTVGPFFIDMSSHIIKKDGNELHLTPIEFKLLGLLLRNANRVITHRQLLIDVWGPVYGSDVQYLRVFMKQLRQKIEDNPSHPQFLVTEPGIGYRFKVKE